MEVQGAASEVEACLTALRREMGANIRREDTARADVVEGDAGFRITR
jgi:hypothetical protein